jgi:nucleoside-diphosphate-sugar epimerase
VSHPGLPRVLIIGGSRFVGLPLVELLVRGQYHVTVLNRGNHNDRLPAGVETLVVDRKDHQAMAAALRGRRFAAAFDLVAYAPEDTEGLLAALDTTGLEHLIHISTGSVYLPSDYFPLKEHFARGPRGPGHEYGDRKYHIEEQLFAAYREHGLPVTIIRPGVLFGPGNYVYREAFYFDRLLAGRPLLVPNDGSVLTQFGYVDDLAHMMVAVLGNRRAIGEAYNFAGEYSVTTDRYMRAVIEVVGSAFGARRQPGGRRWAEPEVVHYDPEAIGLTPAEVRAVFPYRVREHVVRDMSKAASQLGHRETVDLVEGLRRSYAWFVGGGREACGFAAPDFGLEDRILELLRG